MSTLRTMIIFLSEYSTIDCAWKLPSQQNALETLQDVCLAGMLPQNRRVWVEKLTVDIAMGSKMCFAYMDLLNAQLLAAFDPYFYRLVRVSTAMATLVDYLSRAWDNSAGVCNDFSTSPYVASIQPEPIDYFRACAHTYDCKVKCKENYDAFEQAKDALTLKQILQPQTKSRQVAVTSYFFTVDDIANNLHLAPMRTLGM